MSTTITVRTGSFFAPWALPGEKHRRHPALFQQRRGQAAFGAPAKQAQSAVEVCLP